MLGAIKRAPPELEQMATLQSLWDRSDNWDQSFDSAEVRIGLAIIRGESIELIEEVAQSVERVEITRDWERDEQQSCLELAEAVRRGGREAGLKMMSDRRAVVARLF